MSEYGYEVWFDGQLLTETSNYDNWYESEDDAWEAAEDAIRDRIADWKSEGCYNGEQFEEFDIEIKER